MPRLERAAAFLVMALLLPGQAVRAQGYSRGSVGGTSRQRSGGGDFPSWEGDVQRGLRAPLPEGPRGRQVPALSIDLAEPATGVVATPDHQLAVALSAGKLRVVDLAGKMVREIETGFPLDAPPLLAGDGILVSGPGHVALVVGDAVSWKAETRAGATYRPSVSQELAFLVAPDGTLQARNLDGGNVAFRTPLPSELACGPAVARGRLVFGFTDGQIAGLDPANGAIAWTRKVADRVDTITADKDSVFASGYGHSSRRGRDIGPIALRLGLGENGEAAERPAWRLRMGGACLATPLLVDELVLFPSLDGFVHAVQRGKGIQGWTTDLPSRATETPRLAGGRLDFVLPLTPHVVSLAADNGAIMGWSSLKSPDETFIGAATWVTGVTVAVTSFWRLYGFTWEPDESGEPDSRRERSEPGGTRRTPFAVNRDSKSDFRLP